MAETIVLTGDALTVKAWVKKLFLNTTAKTYFSKFFGGEESIVQVDTKLTGMKGDKVTFGLVMDLDEEDYVTSTQTLEGNEQALTSYDYDLTLEEYALAVVARGAMDFKRPLYDMNETMRNRIMLAGAKLIDFKLFQSLQASPTKIFYGDGSSTATVTTAGLITPALISQINTWAATGGNGTQPIIRPVRVNGKDYRVLLVHDDVAYDLNQNSVFTQARREAEVRGKENPIFNGAYMIWDGVVVHKHPKVNIVTNWGAGSDVPGAKCFLLGAQALALAWGVRPKIVPGSFDWGRKRGYSWQAVFETGKPKFNSKDYGAVALYVARTQVSDG